MVKENGVERPFFKGSIENTDIDELPPFLYPLQMDNAKFKLEFPEGNRTQKLGAYLFYLVEKGFTVDQAFQIVELLNKFIFENPIPENTFKGQILNDTTYKKLLDKQKENTINKITPSDIAKEIINKFTLITINDNFYNYENGVYKPFPKRKITKYLTENYPKSTGYVEKEVIRHISGLTYSEIPKDNRTVNVKNGILQFSDNGNVTLLPHSKDNISFIQFNAAYEPNITSPLLDKTLSIWFENNSNQIELFKQLLGYLLMRHVHYQKVFFFVGAPSTGKTTILKLITCFCGNENVSAIQLEDMKRNFILASIVNKVANIFSDIRKTKVIGSDIFKMLADGSALTIDPKFGKPFTYCFTGKLLFGMNDYPDFSQDFDGIARRIVIFEFKHIFFKDDPEFNPAIIESLSENQCMTALLNKAISGYQSLIANKGFINTKESDSALNNFINDNDNVMKWLYEANITQDHLLREPINYGCGKGLYGDYKGYCFNIGEIPKEQKDFSRTICRKYNFETFQKRSKDNGRFQMFRKK